MLKSFLSRFVMTLLILGGGLVAYAAPDQLNDDDTTVSSACTDIPVRIQYGSRDVGSTGNVMMLQDFLYENNYLTIQPTGFYGAGTLKAVKAFQKANGISQTGSLVPVTRAKINTISCLGGVAQGDTQIVATNTLSPASVASKTVCSGVRPVAGVNGVASVRDYSGNTWGGGDTTKPSTVWHFGTDSSCSYQCAAGMVQDVNNGCKKSAVVSQTAPVTPAPVITCSGSRPTAGIGGVTAGIGYSPTSVGGGGSYTARSDWHYGTDSCSWGCDFPMTYDGSMGCKNPPAGTGVRVRVIDITGKGVPNVSIVRGNFLGAWGGEVYKAITTNANGDAPEFWYAYASSANLNFINVDVPGYKIKSATGCTVFVGESYGKQLNQCSGASNSTTNSVEITIVSGDASGTPVTSFGPSAGQNYGSCGTGGGLHSLASFGKCDSGVIEDASYQPAKQSNGTSHWYCKGVNGGTKSELCWSPTPVTSSNSNVGAAVNGSCGTGGGLHSLASYGTCDSGVIEDASYQPAAQSNGTSHWYCKGVNGGAKSELCWSPTRVTAVSNTKNNLMSIASAPGKVLGDYASNASCVDLTSNLHRGAEGLSVTKLQDYLASKGLLVETDRGFYGDSTIAAVKDYQLSMDLPVTGMVYDATRFVIKMDSCK